jgi:hypothetical protein
MPAQFASLINEATAQAMLQAHYSIREMNDNILREVSRVRYTDQEGTMDRWHKRLYP